MIKRLIFCTLFLVVASTGFTHGKWVLEKNANGVQVFTRENDNSSIKEFKAVATVFADRLDIARCVSRVTDYPNWFPDCGESRIIDIISPTKRKTYYKVDLPWPATDRYCYMIMHVETDDAKKETTIHFNDTDGEEVDGCVRMANADGFWRITTLDDKRTKVIYQFISDPAGALPAWIINMFIVDNPYDALMALKKKLEK
ncbi:MAG: START domain-containing protein [Crocinitomicaceae bacterium]